jgi:hypothetical protein
LVGAVASKKAACRPAVRRFQSVVYVIDACLQITQFIKHNALVTLRLILCVEASCSLKYNDSLKHFMYDSAFVY